MVSIFLMGLPVLLMTLVPNIYAYYVFSVIFGVGSAAVAIAGNSDCLEIWRGRESDGGPMMYAVHACFALGSLIGPLIAGPALNAENGMEFKIDSAS